MQSNAAVRTFVFTDIEGSTGKWELHPESMRDAVANHDRILREAVDRHSGVVVKTTGDGMMAAFLDPVGAVTAAAEMVATLEQSDWGDIGSLTIRVGVHMGDAEQRADDFFGPTVNRTARIMGIGHGGQVLVSEAVEQRIRGRLGCGLSFRDLGHHRLKDLGGAQRIYQLLGPSLVESFPPLKSLDVTPNNLPSQQTELLGRGEELRRLRSLLDSVDVRLVTATGPGGTGKTRLALQAAAEQVDRFPDGVQLVDLAAVRDPDGVLSAVVRVVGATKPSEEGPFEVAVKAIGDRQMLLVLDNFEQVIPAAHELIALLERCPNLNILVTSREALRVRGEQVFPVDPLAVPAADADLEDAGATEAVELFVARARAVDHGFELTEANAAHVVAICRRLDGLPLAIELAAARLRLFDPAELLARLETRLDLLRGGARDLPDRQRTLRGTIDWSYELLTPGERVQLCVLGVFSGAFLDSLEAVAGTIDGVDPFDVLDDVESLVAKSLLRSERTPGGTRFTMLETVREYTRDRLSEDADLERAVRRAHADHFAGLSVDLRERLAGPERRAALDVASIELGNLRNAWSYSVTERDVERLRDLLDALWSLHDAQGQYHGALELASDLLGVLEFSPESADRARDQVALQMSVARAIMAIRGYTQEVEDAFLRAMELGGGDGAARFPVLRSLATLYVMRTEFEKAAAVGSELLAIAESVGSKPYLVDAHLVRGVNLVFSEHREEGFGHLEQAIADFDPREAVTERFRLGPNAGVVSLTTSAFILWTLGFPDRAMARAEQAIEAARALDHPYSLAYALFHVAHIHAMDHDLEGVATCVPEQLAVSRRYGYLIWEALAVVLSGFLRVAGGDGGGLDEIERGMEMYETASAPPVFWPLVLNLRTSACLVAGRPDLAEGYVDEALGVLPEDSPMWPPIGISKGDVVAALGDRSSAAGWYERAIASARSHDGRMAELGARTRLAGIEPSGERLDALASVLAGFTEGHSHRAILEAEELLRRRG